MVQYGSISWPRLFLFSYLIDYSPNDTKKVLFLLAANDGSTRLTFVSQISRLTVPCAVTVAKLLLSSEQFSKTYGTRTIGSTIQVLYRMQSTSSIISNLQHSTGSTIGSTGSTIGSQDDGFYWLVHGTPLVGNTSSTVTDLQCRYGRRSRPARELGNCREP